MSRLRCYFNWLALEGLGTFADPVASIKAAGYDGIQLLDPLDQQALRRARAHGAWSLRAARA